MTKIFEYDEKVFSQILNEIDNDEEIILYSTATYLKYLFDTTNLEEKNIPFFIDQFNNWDILGKEVKSPEILKEYEPDYLIIALFSGRKRIYEYIVNEIGYKGKIIFINPKYKNHTELIKGWEKYVPYNSLIDMRTEDRQLKASDLNDLCSIFYYGRSGSVFFHSLLDNHPQILTIPGMYITDFYDFWEVCESQNLNLDRIADVFAYFYYYIFDSRNSRGESAGFDKMGENREKFLLVDKEVFIRELKTIIKLENKHTRKFFFQAIHLAYEIALGKKMNLSKDKYVIVFHAHTPSLKVAEKLKEDFEDVKFIHTIRKPIQGFGSFIKSKINNKGFNINSFISIANNMLNSIPISLCFIKNTYLIKLEDLHLKSRETLEKVCEVINIEWNDTLLQSTFNGLTWWNLKGSKVFTGFNKEVTTKRYDDVLTDFDRFRWNVLFRDKCKAWGYEFEKFNDYRLMKELLKYPFEFEEYLASDEEEKKLNRKKIEEYLLSYLDVLFYDKEKPIDNIRLI